MEDFDALASSLAVGVGDVRGCLILSRDGSVLGAHPADAETRTRLAWLRFAALGDLERGFAQFGTETWCYVRRGLYAGFSALGPGARPGLVIDHMDQVLLAADEARSRHEGLRGVEVQPTAPVSKRRSHLHYPATDQVVIDAPPPVAAQPWSKGSADEMTSLPPPNAGAGDGGAFDPPPHAEPPRPDAPAGHGDRESSDRPAYELGDVPEDGRGPDTGDEPGGEPVEEPAGHDGGDPYEGDDVDRFSLAREFGQLLQHDEDPADG
ncbi:MAG: hypothetical protein WB297_08420 [Actinomycetota bacterium]